MNHELDQKAASVILGDDIRERIKLLTKWHMVNVEVQSGEFAGCIGTVIETFFGYGRRPIMYIVGLWMEGYAVNLLPKDVKELCDGRNQTLGTE